MHQLVGLELGDERDAALAELARLQGQMHDRAVAMVGPMPLPPDLTMQQVRVLGCVVKEPGLSGHDLGVRIGVSAPTASGLVDRLVEKGLISRTDDPDDRRVRRIHPTEDGLAVIREMDSLFSRAMGARGWIGMTWPTEFGGGGATHGSPRTCAWISAAPSPSRSL